MDEIKTGHNLLTNNIIFLIFYISAGQMRKLHVSYFAHTFNGVNLSSLCYWLVAGAQ